jgi:hypothetical protein
MRSLVSSAYGNFRFIGSGMKINMQFRKPTVWGRYVTALITFMAAVGAREDGFEVSDTANGADLYLTYHQPATRKYHGETCDASPA